MQGKKGLIQVLVIAQLNDGNMALKNGKQRGCNNRMNRNGSTFNPGPATD